MTSTALTLDLSSLVPLPPLPLRELVASLVTDDATVLRCEHCQAARWTPHHSRDHLSDVSGWKVLHEQCGKTTDPGGRGE